jgi:hypothetical protein
MINRQLILDMIEDRFCFAPTSPGMTRSDYPHWQKAIPSKDLVESWLDDGKSLVFVAKRGHGFVIDIDDPDALIAKGFDPEWLKGYFRVDTPSGGHHIYGLAGAITDAMPGIVLVFEEKGNRDSKKIFELKIHAQSTAAPSAERKGQKNKCDGEYKPGRHYSPKGTKRGVPPELLEWLKQNAETMEQVVRKKLPWNFHPDFDEAELAENEGCTIAWSDYIDDTYHIVVEECPHCGRENTGAPRAAKAKLILGGNGYGFVCHACGIEGEGATKKHQELMQKLDPYYSIWDEPIYVHDDMKLMAEEMDKDGFSEEAPMPEDEASETYEEHDPVPKFKGKIVMPGSQPEPQPVHHNNNDARLTLKYPELAFPYESLPPGRLKDLVDKACEGDLDPGLACPAIMALASSLPFKDRMDGAKINLYVCLLALVGAGKDTAIKRALNVLGIEGNQLIYTSYAPSGERSIAMLLGDKQAGPKNSPITTPGPLRHCIVTTELEDTLAKSRGETSSVLQAMQHYWDHNNKTYSDAKKGVQKVNCRLSWLTALPVGDDEISTDAFRLAFGEHTSHGIVDRMFFGFSERKFDGRRSRNWEVPFNFNNYTIVDDSPMDNPNVKVQVERTETLLGRLQKAEVVGFAAGVEELYLNWSGEGRRTYDLLKLAVLVALINGHKQIEMEDWQFTCALMDWQARIREVFSTGKAKRVHQGEMNEMVIKELEKRTAKVLDGITNSNMKMFEQKNGKGEKVDKPFVRWKAMANEGRWYKFGMDAERTIDQLQKAAAIQFRELYPGEETTEIDKSWIRLMGQPK